MHIQPQPTPSPYNHLKNDHYLIEHNKTLRCICQLCSCGKHHCPKKTIKTDFQTSYSRCYQKPPTIPQIDQRSPYRYQERHYSPEVLRTNYQQHFQSHQQSQPQGGFNYPALENIGKTILAPQVPFVGVSAYKDQYQPYRMIRKQQQVVGSPNPQQIDSLSPYQSSIYKKPVARFQGISSYKSTFLPPPQPQKPSPKPSYRKPQMPFYGSSTYKDQYRPVEILPYEEIHNGQGYRDFKTVKFEGKSAYNEQFQPYRVQAVGLENLNSSNRTNACRLDQIVVPSVNYVNQEEHVYFDPETKRFS